MFVQSSLKRTLTAILAAIATSTIAVGAAVAPAQAGSAAVQVTADA